VVEDAWGGSNAGIDEAMGGVGHGPLPDFKKQAICVL
jgi:hypothetical protein